MIGQVLHHSPSMLPTADPSAPLSAWLLLLPAVGLGFFLAGRATFAGIASPLPWATAFVGSALVLFFTSFFLQSTGVPITLPTLAFSISTLSLLGWLSAGRPPLFSKKRTGKSPRALALQASDLFWLIPGGAAFCAILVHAFTEPLSGFDNSFRWNYLSLAIEATGGFSYYPPVTAEDFRVYPWCDGIPPLVPLLNLWIYSATGSTAGVLTIGRIATELGLTLALVWHLSGQLWGRRGAQASVLLLATSAIFAWSLAMGQETGASGVMVIILASLLCAYHHKPAGTTAVWIGLTAGALSLCRDYNLLFIPIALALLALRASRRDLFVAALAIALTVSPWYIRNAWLTRNPLYPHDLGGHLPSNARYADYITAARSAIPSILHPDTFLAILKTVLAGGGILALASLPAWFRRDFRLAVVLSLAATGVALWALAYASTGGGMVYSLRVLGIVAPLCAVAGGWWGDKLRGRGLVAIMVALSLVFADAARRARFMFFDPLVSPLPYYWNTTVNYDRVADESRPAFLALIAAAQGEGIIVDLPSYFVSVGRLDGRVISQFSPEADPLFKSSTATPLADTVKTLRQARIRFVFLAQTNDGKMEWINATPALAKLWATPPQIDAGIARVYDLALIAGESPPIVLQVPR